MNNKVLFITVRSDIGGGPKHVFDVCDKLKNSIEVYIAAPIGGQYYNKYVEIAKDCIEIPYRKFSIKSLIEILIFIRNNGINKVHSHGRGAGVYSRILSLWGVKVIHTFHGAHHTSLFEYIMSNTIEKYIAVSESEKKNAVKLKLGHWSNISVIPNSIDIRKFEKIKSPNQNVIGIISRLDPHKNNIEIIRYMKKLPDYKLLIAGDGEELEYLKSEAGENVEFLGFINDIQEFLSKIDIYVSSSLGEGMPYSALEAMAANKKILLSNVVGHTDLVSEDNLYKLGDYISFKKKLDCATPVKLDSKYTIEKMVNELLSKYFS